MVLPFQTNIESKNLKQFNLKDLKIRKKMEIFYDEKNIIFYISQKSRFLLKDTIKIQEIYFKVSEHLKIENAKKAIYIDALVCSKAKKELEENLNYKLLS